MKRASVAWDPDPLHKGDRVRLRLSGECRCWEYAHVGHRSGMLGTVCDVVRGDRGLVGHHYAVEIDGGFNISAPAVIRGHYSGDYFARAELERLESFARNTRAAELHG